MKVIILIILSIFTTSLLGAHKHFKRSLASIPGQIRIDHAKELLGSRYKKSHVAKFEHSKALEDNIFATVLKNLPTSYQPLARAVAITIIKESSKHELDPYFVMAVISGESSFNPTAVGPVGEVGLMQLRPSTAQWIAKKAKFKWRGMNTLRDPISNIKIGTFYLSYLRAKFSNHSQLYLAAYNMGATSVKRALAKNIRPKDYPLHVMKRYLAFYKKMVF